MIQRKQTIYLLLAGVFAIILFFVPFANIQLDKQDYEFTISGIKSITPSTNSGVSTVPLMIILSLITGLCFTTIFFYKKRSIQMKLCIFTIILNIGICGLVIFHIIRIFVTGKIYYWSFILFFLILILLILAYLGIRKDEKLVKSLDRIR